MSKEQFVAVYRDLESAERVASAILKAVVFRNLIGSGTHYPADESVVIVNRDSSPLIEQGRRLHAVTGDNLQLFANGNYEAWVLVERRLTAQPVAAQPAAQPVMTTEERRLQEFDRRHGIQARG